MMQAKFFVELACSPQVIQCEITWEAVKRQLTAPWFLSHFIGWFGKMVVFRDLKFCMVASLLFELTELSLQFVIPEFAECWWDSIFMDFLGANALGLIAGHMFMKFLNNRTVRILILPLLHVAYRCRS